MNFTNLPDIILTGLQWFFPTAMLTTPTFQFFTDLALFLGGCLGFYYIGIFPFVICIKCIIKDWRVRR